MTPNYQQQLDEILIECVLPNGNSYTTRLGDDPTAKAEIVALIKQLAEAVIGSKTSYSKHLNPTMNAGLQRRIKIENKLIHVQRQRLAELLGGGESNK